MKQEEKELLLKDLCARLPYNTKIQLTEYSVTGKKLPSEIKILDYCMLGKVQAYCKGFRKDEIKPYLFPLSSMTEEQRKEFDDLTKVLHDFMKNHAKGNDVTERFFYTQIELWKLKTDWLNKNHFDYRGLIPMGLANDATGLNIY